jgi:membrane protein
MHMMRFSLPHCSIAFGLLKRIAREWSADNAPRWSASVAFYTLLSLAPLLVLTVAIAGLVYSKRVAQGQLVLGLKDLVGSDVSPAIQILLTSPHKPVSGLLAAVFGIVTLFFGASAVLTELRDALNAIWHVPVNRNCTRFANLLRLAKERAYSFVMILGLGILLLVSLVLNTWLAAIETFFGWRMFASGYLLHLTAFLISCLVITFVFAAIYKLIPKVSLNWSDVAVGGVVTSVLFIIGKQLIAFYLGRTNLWSAYGAAGSLMVVLVWVYYSAQVFFFGAEFTKVYAETFGSQKSTAHSQNKVSDNEPLKGGSERRQAGTCEEADFRRS